MLSEVGAFFPVLDSAYKYDLLVSACLLPTLVHFQIYRKQFKGKKKQRSKRLPFFFFCGVWGGRRIHYHMYYGHAQILCTWHAALMAMGKRSTTVALLLNFRAQNFRK